MEPQRHEETKIPLPVREGLGEGSFIPMLCVGTDISNLTKGHDHLTSVVNMAFGQFRFINSFSPGVALRLPQATVMLADGQLLPNSLYVIGYYVIRHFLPAPCPLPTAHRPLPTAPCLPPTAHCLPPTAYRPLPTANRPLPTLSPFLSRLGPFLPTAIVRTTSRIHRGYR